MSRAGLMRQPPSPLATIMSTNGVVELCGALEPGVPYDKATCLAERYGSLLGVEINKVCCGECVGEITIILYFLRRWYIFGCVPDVKIRV